MWPHTHALVILLHLTVTEFSRVIDRAWFGLAIFSPRQLETALLSINRKSPTVPRVRPKRTLRPRPRIAQYLTRCVAACIEPSY
jgi:hypothetical protein